MAKVQNHVQLIGKAMQSGKIINSEPYTIPAYLKKLQHYGYLLQVLAERELKVKYTRTLLGIGWLFLQPLGIVVVYSVFFKYIIHINSDNIPYPAFVFSGLVLWYLFTGIVGRCSHALTESSDLIGKVSFPRLLVIAAKIIPTVLECLVLLLLLFVVNLVTGISPGIHSLESVFYFLSVLVFSIALGLLCSILVLKYRDLAHLIPFAINFLIWLTPVFYPASIIPEKFRALSYLNPLALPLEGMRRAVFFNEGLSLAAFMMFLISVALLLISFFYFVKFEKKIVENL